MSTARSILPALLLVAALGLAAVVLIGAPVAYVLVQRSGLETERRIAAERAAEEREQQLLREIAAAENQAGELTRQLEAEERARKAAEQARLEAELQATLHARLASLELERTAAVVTDQRTFDKLMNSQRFGTHWIYDEHGFGSATIEVFGDVVLFQGSNRAPGRELTLNGMITAIDAKGVTLEGRFDLRYDDDPPCGASGRHRLNLVGHPHYFRLQGPCEGRHHYIDLFVDDAWMAENPE